MARQSGAQRKTVRRVMHEHKHGELKRKGGRKVRSRRQAIAIALREAGASREESPRKNRQNLRKTKARERQGQTGEARAEGARPRRSAIRRGSTRADLYAEARKRNIPGRSRMSKAQLERALRR